MKQSIISAYLELNYKRKLSCKKEITMYLSRNEHVTLQTSRIKYFIFDRENYFSRFPAILTLNCSNYKAYIDLDMSIQVFTFSYNLIFLILRVHNQFM